MAGVEARVAGVEACGGRASAWRAWRVARESFVCLARVATRGNAAHKRGGRRRRARARWVEGARVEGERVWRERGGGGGEG